MKIMVSFTGGIIVEVDDKYKPIDSMSEESCDKMLDDLFDEKEIVLDGIIDSVAEWEE